ADSVPVGLSNHSECDQTLHDQRLLACASADRVIGLARASSIPLSASDRQSCLSYPARPALRHRSRSCDPLSLTGAVDGQTRALARRPSAPLQGQPADSEESTKAHDDGGPRVPRGSRRTRPCRTSVSVSRRRSLKELIDCKSHRSRSASW